jgi:hypothetical protein
MSEMNDAQVKDLLKQALHPADSQLPRDLWPQMLRRLDECSPDKAVPWFDWALLIILAICILAFPHSIPVLLYHL